MKTVAWCAFTGILAATAAVQGVHREAGTVVINLDQPGDAILVTLDGTKVGGLRVDEEGRLALFGPNHSSSAITIDGRDRVQIDPEPVSEPPSRLTIANDVWLTGFLRVGRADAFGDAPFDPNGAIQVGRNLQVAQPMALFRAFAQGEERWRLGTTAEGDGFWSDGAHDVPLMTFHASPEGAPTTGRVTLRGAELATR
jgi:hypothetical protein